MAPVATNVANVRTTRGENRDFASDNRQERVTADSIRSELSKAYDGNLRRVLVRGAGRHYDYDVGGGSYDDGSAAMVGGEAVAVDEYAHHAYDLVMSVPAQNAAASDTVGEDWLPLGVFAVAAGGESIEVPAMFVQLAIRNDGVIAATYQHSATGEPAAAEGMADQESQRAARAFSGRSLPIVETGRQNLPTNETQILVHFADRTETYLMVRVENPDARA